MPLIPTYSTGIGAPDLAGAYLGAQRIRQQAAADNARISLGYAQLQQEAVANEMELAAKKELMAQQALKQAQEAEIEKSYRATQLGLRQRELANEEAIGQMRIADAAREFDRMQGYQRRVTELSKTLPLEEAARQAILESGGTGLSTALERPNPPAPRKYSAVVGTPQFFEPPPKLSMTAPEFESFMMTAPPELRTNSVNATIQGMLRPPSGTNAPTATGTNRTVRVVRDANGKLVIQR